MRCPKCHAENRVTAKFCDNCGSAIFLGCPSCGADVRPTARFCDSCGTPLTHPPSDLAQSATPTPASQIPTGPPAPEAPGAASKPVAPADGERRHLTVLFCDLAGSTALSAALDPEDWRATVAAYHRTAAAAITHFRGYVAKYLGDGVMAFFGYPEAHDHDAEYAVRAGLAILSGLAQLNQVADHPQLSARIGIDSGPVVIGSGATPDADVFGDTPNIAARVQSAAEPDTIVVTAATYRLISGLFIAEDRGPQSLKGIAEPLQLYHILRPSGVRGRLEATAAVRGLTPFVGRDDELRTLAHRWERVCDGEGQVVLIIGEAGIGKSRLLHRFRETLNGTIHTWIDTSAGAFFQNTPFYPVTEMLRQLIWQRSLDRLDDYLRGLKTGDENNGEQSLERGGEVPDQPFAQLISGLAQAGLSPTAAIPLLAPLLNLSLPPDYSPSPLPPDQQRRRLLSTVVEWILGTARTQPLIIATEDLHWADPSTLELIQLLVEQGNTAPLMLLYTARPEFRPPWPLRSHHAQINLNRLSARDVRTIVTQVAAQKAFADETVSAVVERTGGVPLFVEELTRALLERGEARPTGHEIPATLHDSLIARLDRLGSARETLQLGAVLESKFSYELLYALHPAHDHDELQRHLRVLTDAELLYVRGIAPDATYQFKHALIRDAAYEALLKSRRKELHRLVAQTIDTQFPTLKENQPEVLAHHWTEAGLFEQAVRYWRRAAQSAVERFANAEAISYVTKGLELLATLPQTPVTIMEEIRLQIRLINPLIATKGYIAPEVERACDRAMELSRQSGDSPQLFLALGGLFSVYHNRAEFCRASDIAERMLHVADGTKDRQLIMWSHYALAVNCEAQGRFPDAKAHMEISLALCNPRERSSRGFVQNPLITGSGIMAHIVHSLGYPDQALAKSQKALDDARRLGEPFTLAWTLGSNARLHLRRKSHQRARELSIERIALCEKYGLASTPAEGDLGCALIQEGHEEKGIQRILPSFSKNDTSLQHRIFELYLATANKQMGRVNEGLSIVEKSFAAMNGELYETASALYRLKGELLLMEVSRESEAEECFYRAIELARKNSDKMAELEATTSFVRLFRDTNRRAEAYAILSTVYNWFTEGFDTADLKDAKALLDELSTNQNH